MRVMPFFSRSRSISRPVTSTPSTSAFSASSFGLLLGRHRLERALQIVADHEHVAGELRHRVFPRVLDIALSALPEIVHLGGEPDEPVGQIGLLRLKPRDIGGRIGRRRLGLLAVFGPRAVAGRRKDRVGLVL